MLRTSSTRFCGHNETKRTIRKSVTVAARAQRQRHAPMPRKRPPAPQRAQRGQPAQWEQPEGGAAGRGSSRTGERPGMLCHSNAVPQQRMCFQQHSALLASSPAATRV